MSQPRRQTWTVPEPRPTRTPRRKPRRPLALPTHGVEPPRAIAALARLSARVGLDADRIRAIVAAAFAVCGLALAVLAVWADVTIHRGVADGVSPPVVRQYTGRDLAANVDLTRFAPEQLSAVTAGLQANGIRYVRQSFSWAEIEPAPGEYAWDRYDAIVDALNRRGITPVAVLHRSPPWIRSPEGAGAFDAPPADLPAFERFVTALAGRYGDRVPFIQVWDLPNRASHWGGTSADPASYVSLLAVGSNAARGANPNAVILLAELDVPLDAGGRDDLEFLQGIYTAGGGAFSTLSPPASTAAGAPRSTARRRQMRPRSRERSSIARPLTRQAMPPNRSGRRITDGKRAQAAAERLMRRPRPSMSSLGWSAPAPNGRGWVHFSSGA